MLRPLIFAVSLVLACCPIFGQSASDSTKHSVKTLRFSLPPTWLIASGSGTETFRSEKFVEEASSSYVIVDVSVNGPEGRSASTCLDKTVNFAGGDWQRSSNDDESRALQIETDKSGAVVRVSALGCNRGTTWSLVFVSNNPVEASILNIAKEATKSISYVRKL